MGSDETVASDVFAGRPAHDRRLTIRIANLSDRRDKELRKAIATAKRNFPYRRM